MEYLLYFVGAMLAVALLQAIIKNLWLTFKWNVLGWPPKILDEKLVAATVETCTEHFLHAAQEGCEFNEKEIARMREDMTRYTRAVVETYIDRFTRK